LSDALALGTQIPRELAGKHPWASLLAGAAAGFAAAAVAVPSREQQALRKLAKIERALNLQQQKPEENGHPPTHAPPAGEQAFKSGRTSLTRAILSEVIGALKPAIVSLLTAGVTASAAKTTPEEMQAATSGQA
jgi:hypothetical protein